MACMQKHVLLGVIARSTLVKLLAHLEVMTAAGHQPSRRGGVDPLATVSSGGSAIGMSPFGSIPEVCPLQPLPSSHHPRGRP